MRTEPFGIRARIVLGLIAVLLAATGCADSTGQSAATTGAAPPPSSASSLPTTTAQPGGQPLPEGTAPDRSFPVGTQTLELARQDRSLPTSVWYPATRTGTNAPAAEGRFPLVVFSHGLSALPRYYASMLRHWASAGFIVVAPAFPHTRAGATDSRLSDIVEQPADVAAVITEVLSPGRLRAEPDASRIAAAGHSAGGITTVLLFTSHRDSRLMAGVVLAGTVVSDAPYRGPAAWLLFVHGTVDLLVPAMGGRLAYRQDPWPKAFLSLPGQGHVDPYLSPGTEAFDEVVDTATDFLRLSLYGDRAAGGRMEQDARPAGDLESSLPTGSS